MLLFPKRLCCFPNYAVVFQVSLLFPNLCCWFPSDAVVSQVTLSIPNICCCFPSDAISQVMLLVSKWLLFTKWSCYFTSDAVDSQAKLLFTKCCCCHTGPAAGADDLLPWQHPKLPVWGWGWRRGLWGTEEHQPHPQGVSFMSATQIFLLFYQECL